MRHLTAASAARPRSVAVLIAVLAALALMLSACTNGSDGQSASSSDAGSGQSEQPTATETTAPPTTVAPQTDVQQAPCPYLDKAFVQDTVGQRINVVIVTTITPAPGPGPKCEFQRPNGEIAATVDTLTAADVTAAQQYALAFAPGGNPVQAGDGGSVLVKAGQAETVMGVYRGTTVVFVTINQESSLEARELAAAALTVLP